VTPARRTAAPRATALLLGLVPLLAVALVFSLGIGAVSLTPDETAAALLARLGRPGAAPEHVIIVWDLRLARALLAVLIGVGLATAGAAYQAVFRNPLADPFVIGASGGAALGATAAIVGGAPFVMPAAFIGAIAAVAAVYLLAQAGARPSAINLLLAGAALSTLLSAGVTLLMFLSDRALSEVFAWLSGGLAGRSWPHLRSAALPVLLGALALWALNRPLDALAGGDETAQSLGLNLPRARLAIVAAATVATAAAVAVGGIIGFVGLIVPHIGRRVVGGAHARLIPFAALAGGLLVLLADNLARTVVAPVELPVGVLMALIGAPFFLWLLKRG
jgi:iron complex transport system permease protein